VLAPGLDDRVPEVRAARRIGEVDLVADLAGPTGATDDHGDAVDVGVQRPVVLHVQDLGADELGHDVLRLRALHLHGVDLGQCDGRVEALALSQAERVQVRVAVREAQPERVLVAAQQHGVVDDAAVGGDDQDVLALADRARVQIAARDHVGQLEPVRAVDLDHALDADVPDRDVVQQRPVLLDRVVVVPGQVHVVVDVVCRAARLERGLEERRLPVPGSEVQRGRCFGGRRLTQAVLLSRPRPMPKAPDSKD
jgi:hypothetical protein